MSESDKPKKMTPVRWLLVGLLGLLCTISAVCLFSSRGASTASENCDRYLETTEPIVQEFINAVEVANSTPRISLASAIPPIQDARLKMDDVFIPDCATKAHTALVLSTDAYIDAFLAFLADADAGGSEFEVANALFDEYIEAVAELSTE